MAVLGAHSTKGLDRWSTLTQGARMHMVFACGACTWCGNVVGESRVSLWTVRCQSALHVAGPQLSCAARVLSQKSRDALTLTAYVDEAEGRVDCLAKAHATDDPKTTRKPTTQLATCSPFTMGPSTRTSSESARRISPGAARCAAAWASLRLPRSRA